MDDVGSPPRPLFRPEVLSRRPDRLEGEISLAIPLSWHVIGYVLLAILVVSGLLLASGSYSHVETVKGTLSLDRGTIPILSNRAGILMYVASGPGEHVAAGTPLARIETAESLSGGGTNASRVIEAINQRDAEVVAQVDATVRAATADMSRIQAQVAGLRAEIKSLDAQILTQVHLVENAQQEVAIITDAVARGFISRRDVVQRQEAALARRQQLDQLRQNRSAKQAAIHEAEQQLVQIGAESLARQSSLRSSRSELEQARVEAQERSGYVLKAPVSGTLTAITARPGQMFGAQTPLLTLIPDDATLLAELQVPSRAIGFLAPGQHARLTVDAFPVGQFGTIDAVITEVSEATISMPDGSGAPSEVFLVRARIPNPWVQGFGRRFSLRPGMSLTARIASERRSLLQWLFEPLFAVSGR